MSVDTAGLGPAIRDARRLMNLSRAEIGDLVGMSARMIGMIETAARRLPKDVAQNLLPRLDNPWVYMRYGYAACGGVMAPPVLDGPRVDLDRNATRLKVAEELTEVLAALAGGRCLINARGPEQLTAEDRRQIEETIHPEIEAITGLMNDVAVKCMLFRFSPRRVWVGHIRELESKGYVAREKSAA